MDSILDYPRDWMEASVSGTRVSKAGVVQDVIRSHCKECFIYSDWNGSLLQGFKQRRNMMRHILAYPSGCCVMIGERWTNLGAYRSVEAGIDAEAEVMMVSVAVVRT